jgi:hypothetical protein
MATGDDNGRPNKVLHWDRVDHMLEAGCTGTQIASVFDMHPDTFYLKVKKEKGMGFTEYCRIKKDCGDSRLLSAQFDKALTGDNTMLVWLGKNRLKQRDAPIDMQVTQAQVDINEAVMAQLTLNQQAAKDALESNKEEKPIADDHTESHSDI